MVALALLVASASGCDRLYARRVISYPHLAPVTNVGWYQPRVRVAGGGGAALPLATPGALGLAEPPLLDLVRWADRGRSRALLVVVDGRLVVEAYFRGHSARAITNSFSLAKTLLGLLVGIAIDEGAIGSVRDPVSAYLPEWRGDARSRITIEDLLRMQSGLRNENCPANVFHDLTRMHLGSDLERVVLAVPAVRAPGRRWEYNDLGSQALALALERATGTPYAEYLSTRLWAPLGAGDASLWLDRPGGHAKAYCCVFATARDWARVGELLRSGGRARGRQIVPEAWVRQMRSPSVHAPQYGYQIWLGAHRERATPDFFYLDGLANQRVWVVPELSAVIVRLGERPLRWDEGAAAWAVARALGR